MFMMCILMSVTLMISMVMMIISSIISKKTILDREKNTPFECGFEPFNSSRLPFSLQFFLIALIFLIFDLEIALMMPMIFTMKINNINSWLITSVMFIMILIMGLYHEWNQGALEWSK